MTNQITVHGQGGTFAAYIARPKTSPASAVVVLQELFGVNADIRKHCDQLAEQGFLAVAPDLFWRREPGVDLNVTCESDWQHGLRLHSAYDRDAGAKDVKDTIDAVRSLPDSQRKGCRPWLSVEGGGKTVDPTCIGVSTEEDRSRTEAPIQSNTMIPATPRALRARFARLTLATRPPVAGQVPRSRSYEGIDPDGTRGTTA